MDECLKYLRAIYLAMLLVAALVLVICTTTYQMQNHQHAVAELQSLKTLAWGDYGDFAIDVLEQNLRERSVKEIQADYASTFHGKHQLTVLDSFSSTLLPLIPLPHANSSVGEYRALLLAPAEIGYYKPDHAARVYSKVSTDFANPASNSAAFSRQSTIHSLSYELSGNPAALHTRIFPSGQAALTLPLLPTQLEVIHHLHYTLPDSTELKQRSISGHLERAVISGPFIRHWLRSRQSPLLSPRLPEQPVLALPSSMPFSSSIDNLTPDEAIERLNAKIAEQHNRYGFLAHTYVAGLAGLIAPSVLLALLMALVIVQRRLYAPPGVENPAASGYFWIGLYKDSLSRLTFISSIILLPAASMVSCAVLLMEVKSGLFYFTCAIAIAALALSLMTWRENRKLHPHAISSDH